MRRLTSGITTTLGTLGLLCGGVVLGQSASLKPQLTGLLDRQAFPPAAFAEVMGGWVVKANWAELQPRAGGELAPGNVIDDALKQTRAYNAAHPDHPLYLKIRVYAGVNAPDWLKTQVGSFRVTSPQNGTAGTVPRFWTPAAMQAYADLQARLAARYDADPLVREVAVGGCMTLYAETFIRQASDRENVRAMLGAGYTAEQDRACHEQQLRAMQAWKTTHVSLALNPFQALDQSGKLSADLAFTLSMMDRCRTLLGPRCVLANNSLRTAKQGEDYPAMYTAMQQRGGPIMFQTATLEKIGWENLLATLQKAVNLGSAAVELPAGYNKFRPTDLAPYGVKLAQQAR